MEPSRESGRSRHGYKTEIFLLIVITLLSSFMLIPPGMVNEALLWDDKAYINNALIASGRISPEKVWGPYAEERPPLFWWLITGIYLLNAPIWVARLISPLFGIIAAISIYLALTRILGNPMPGFASSALLVVSSFFITTTSNILTDTMGAALSTLYFLSLYIGFFHDRRGIWMAGPLLSLSIISRDQNLILIPITLVYFLWISGLTKYLKVLITFLLLALMGGVLVLFPLHEVLQVISNIITPLIISQKYLPVLLIITLFNAVLLTYKIPFNKDDSILRKSLLDITLGVCLALITIHPYFMDNYRLGAEYQVVGKGVFSRPISHFIMARTIGIGANLPYWERWSWWINTSIQVLTIPVIALAIIGALFMWKSRKNLLLLILLWSGFVSAFVIFFTHLEARFIIQAFPPIFILAGYALHRILRINFTVGVGLLALTVMFLLFPNSVFFLPKLDASPPTFSSLMIIMGFEEPRETWFSDYLAYLSETSPPSLRINPILPILGLLSPTISVMSLWIFSRKMYKGLDSLKIW